MEMLQRTGILGRCRFRSGDRHPGLERRARAWWPRCWTSAPPPSPPNWTKPAACARKPPPCSPITRPRPPAPKREAESHPRPKPAPKPPASRELSRADLKAQIERRAQAAQDKIAQAEAAAMNEIRALAADAAVAAAAEADRRPHGREARGRADRAKHQGIAGQAELAQRTTQTTPPSTRPAPSRIGCALAWPCCRTCAMIARFSACG